MPDTYLSRARSELLEEAHDLNVFAATSKPLKEIIANGNQAVGTFLDL